MVQADSLKNTLDLFGWYDAYAGSAQFRKDLAQEEKAYAQILARLGTAKGLKT